LFRNGDLVVYDSPNNKIMYSGSEKQLNEKKSIKPHFYRKNLLAGLKLRIKDFASSAESLYRYKMACLRKDYLLFENQELQIGIITSLTGKERGSEDILKMILFFGNKSLLPLRDFTVEFSEVGNASLFKKPEPLSPFIESKGQVKQQLLFSFDQWPLQTPQFSGSYRVGGKRVTFDSFLPTLITHFMTFRKFDKDRFDSQFYRDGGLIVSSDEVELDTSITKSIDDFRTFFPSLSVLNEQNKSSGYHYQENVELGGAISLFGSNYEEPDYLLKIKLTPQQTAVFTLAAEEGNSEFVDVILETLTFLFGKE